MKYYPQIISAIFFIFIGHYIIAQNKLDKQFYEDILKIEKIDFHYTPLFLIKNVTDKQANIFPLKHLLNAPDLSELKFNCNDLALFCKLEIKMEHTAKFPIKFRIGEVQYVEQMEGKY